MHAVTVAGREAHPLHPRPGLARALVALGKVSLIAVGLAATLLLAYLLAINAFLCGPVFEKLVDADPLAIDIHFDRAWSLRPGRIHARNLSIRNRDANVEWMLRIRDVKFDVSLWALSKKRFEATHIWGDGGSFRLRRRLDAGSITPQRVAGLPPIEGFGPIPERPYAQCTADEWSDADYHLWTVRLEDIHAARLDEVWIDQGRVEGNTSFTGRFYLRPVRAAEVGPAHIDLDHGRLSVDGSPWVDRLGLSADVALPRFDPRLADGATLQRRVSLFADARGVWPDVARLPLPLPPSAGVRGEVEVRRLAFRLQNGVVAPGSRLDAFAPNLQVTSGEHALGGALATTAEIVDGEAGGRLAVQADAKGMRLARADDAVLRAGAVAASGSGGRIELGHRLEVLHVAVESTDLELPDARVLSAYTSPNVSLAGGHARAEARIEAWPEEKRATLRARLLADDVDARVSGARVRGTLDAKASLVAVDDRLRSVEGGVKIAASVRAAVGGGDLRASVRARGFDPRQGTIDVSGSGVDMTNVKVRGSAAGAPRGRAVLEAATVRLEKPELRGAVSLDVADATPLLTGVREHLPKVLDRLTEMPQLLASARLTLGDHHVDLHDVRARGGSLAARGLFAAKGRDRLGAFVVDAGPWSVGLGLDAQGVHPHLFGLDAWLRRESEAIMRLLHARSSRRAPRAERQR